MKTIKEINKKFDERFPHLVAFSIELAEERRTAIKSFYTQQILSLIEELEGKIPKKMKSREIKHKEIGLKEAPWYWWGFSDARNEAIDQMRATIKSYKKGL